jgi:hypothetical protein
MCGISSGFGAVFGTPLAGTIFGMEVISIGTMEYSVLIPCFIANFSGNLFAAALGAGHAHYIMSGIPELSVSVAIKVVIASLLYGKHPMMPETQDFGIPFCVGHAVGYHVIQACLRKTSISIEKATIIDGDEIMKASGYFEN